MKDNSAQLISYRKGIIAAFLASALGATAIANDDVPAAAPAPSESTAGPSADTQITLQVKARLFDEDALRRSAIRVTVLDGVVTLNGSASSRHAKAVAEAATRSVAGVISVDDTLQIAASSQASADTRDSLARTERDVSDSWITTKVKSAIIADSSVRGFDVNVDTAQGIVMLTGALTDQKAIDHAKNIASRVSGVKGVNTGSLTVAGS